MSRPRLRCWFKHDVAYRVVLDQRTVWISQEQLDIMRDETANPLDQRQLYTGEIGHFFGLPIHRACRRCGKSEVTVIRGKYRARTPHPATWVFAALGALVVFAVLALAGTAVAAPLGAGYVSVPYYQGWRFASASVICIEDRTPTAAMQAATLDATRDYQRNTVLYTTLRRGAGSCAGFDQRVIVMGRNLGATRWLGRVEIAPCSDARTRQCYEWGQTENGNSTWVVRDYAVVMLNTYYRNTRDGWDHIITHELGHAVGLGHRTDTCKSVMSLNDCWAGLFLSGGTWGDIGVVNRIYAQ